ncbi:MAG: hypothetical protein C0448_08050 [Sphingobacteriaceae bacterium]|nr:hypothetical protein [Sphingobacteriaceae bacterium]
MKPFFFKILFFVACSIIGFVFIYSGYTKLYPIEPFEYTFVDLGIGGWKIAPFIARFMIGLEFFIGLLLIFGLYIKRFTLKLTIGSLVIFSIYLLFIIIKTGNNGNCGCFGTAIVMSPLQALIKNGILIIFSFVIYKFYDGIDYHKYGKKLLLATFITSFAMPHILNYVDLDYSSSYLLKKEAQFKLELDSVYNNAKIHTPPKSLSKGKHIMAFMSLTCSHCRTAAKKLKLIKEQNPSISIYFILNGDYEKIQPFFEDTKARNIDYCILNGSSFIYLAGYKLPTIYLVNNSIAENSIDYAHLDQVEIEKWLAKP